MDICLRASWSRAGPTCVEASKAEEAGRVVFAVEPAYTSKTCSRCGAVFDSLTLADRLADCACGLTLDRDHNAILNIPLRRDTPVRAKAQPLGSGTQEAAPLKRQRSCYIGALAAAAPEPSLQAGNGSRKWEGCGAGLSGASL